MKKIIIILWLVLTAETMLAQTFPIGIVSRQDSMRGLQFGLAATLADEQTKGVQIAGFSNMSASALRGLQLAGITNLSMGVERGLQFSGIANVASGYMRGGQMAAYNYADSLNGSQVGLINVARSHPRGWQVGLVNITRDTVAHKIGLVNLNPRTVVDFMLYGGTTTKGNVAVRFRNRSTYSIIGLGTHYMGLDKKFSGAVFYRLGQYFRTGERWSLSGDIGFYHIETFESSGSTSPKRLYSLQARINADYQISKRIGAFVSVGYGDTRYYHHSTRYKNRLLFEAGLTIRNMRGWNNLMERAGDYEEYTTGDSIMAQPKAKRPWIAALEVTGINVGVHCFDRWVLKEDFSQTTLRTLRRNFTDGMVWDNDLFTTNMFAHPYHGNLYFNAARFNGLTFWESAPYALGGSLMWEFLGETEPPAINDVIATSFGGICIGEVTHRMSNVVLDDRSRGFRRFLREAAATVINPIKGLNRIISGDAWRIRHEHYKYHDMKEFPIDMALSVGSRYLADDGALFRGEHNPFVNIYLAYGEPLNGERHNNPYDYFDAEVTFGLSGNQPLINSLHLLGRIWSAPMQWGKNIDAEFGIYQHFNYYDSKPVKDGSNLTPYRISEAASLGPGVIFSFPEVGALSRIEQRVFLSGILLGGTKSDYYSFLERDYNMGSGYSIKTKTHLEMRNFGRFILHAKFFHIFTMKGYEQRDLSDVDPHYINAQGDRGNARLLVITPHVEIDLRKGWSLLASASYYNRKTHYRYYDDVKANTFEVRMGLTCHL